MLIYAPTSRFNFNICSCVRPKREGEKLTGGRGSGVVLEQQRERPQRTKKE